MSERTYSQVNTGISVREASFVSPSQFEQLLASPSSESREGWIARRSRIWQPLKPV